LFKRQATLLNVKHLLLSLVKSFYFCYILNHFLLKFKPFLLNTKQNKKIILNQLKFRILIINIKYKCLSLIIKLYKLDLKSDV
jgi:hypothetical protein